jgi:hypothetical protein
MVIFHIIKGESSSINYFSSAPNLINFDRGTINSLFSIFRDTNNKWYFSGRNFGAFGNGTTATRFLTNTNFQYYARPYTSRMSIDSLIYFLPNNFTCFGIDENSDQVCSSNGRCVSSNLCVCNENYTGLNCQNEVPKCFGVFGSLPSACSGFGTCVSNNNCSCLTDYSGPNCQFINCYGVSTNDSSVCSGNGNCTAPNTCQCNDDSYGPSCSSRTTNKVYASGSNAFFIFGVGTAFPSKIRDRILIAPLKPYNVIQIACTFKTCLALTSDSILLGSGQNGNILFYKIK